MPVAIKADSIQNLAAAKSPKAALVAAVGDLTKFEPRDDLVLVGIYIRPEKTKGGVFLSAETLKEDVYQGKVGLILKMGPDARGSNPEVSVGDWVVTDVKEAWPLRVNDVHCRLVPYERIRMVVDNPEAVF